MESRLLSFSLLLSFSSDDHWKDSLDSQLARESDDDPNVWSNDEAD